MGGLPPSYVPRGTSAWPARRPESGECPGPPTPLFLTTPTRGSVMRALNKKIVTGAVAGAIVLGGSGAAYAYWGTTGGGSSMASTSDGAANLLVTQNTGSRSEEHTSELQSRQYLVCRLLLE